MARGGEDSEKGSPPLISLSLSLCLYAITSQTDLACNRSCRRRLCSRGHCRASPPFRTTNFTHFVLRAPLSVAHFSLPLFLPSSIFLPPSQINSDHDPQHHSAVLGSCPWCAMPLSLSPHAGLNSCAAAHTLGRRAKFSEERTNESRKEGGREGRGEHRTTVDT